MGSNASLAPMVQVGENSVVGANSLAIRKVAPGTTVFGCPALVVEKESDLILGMRRRGWKHESAGITRHGSSGDP